MRTLKLLAIALLGCGGGAGEAPEEALKEAPATSEPPSAKVSGKDAPWPTFRGNMERTGALSPVTLLRQPKLLWRFDTGGKVESSPTVWNGRLFVGSFNEHLFALDATTGRELWRFPVGALVRASPSVVNGNVFFGADDDRFYALDAVSGEERWRYELGPGGEQSSPAIFGERVIFGAFDHHVYALHTDTGELLWRAATGGGIL
ncbi:MAG: PQQ-binding-like beta-propeller repeat protein, partial [Acidobacteriota bacterium]